MSDPKLTRQVAAEDFLSEHWQEPSGAWRTHKHWYEQGVELDHQFLRS